MGFKQPLHLQLGTQKCKKTMAANWCFKGPNKLLSINRCSWWQSLVYYRWYRWHEILYIYYNAAWYCSTILYMSYSHYLNRNLHQCLLGAFYRGHTGHIGHILIRKCKGKHCSIGISHRLLENKHMPASNHLKHIQKVHQKHADRNMFGI